MVGSEEKGREGDTLDFGLDIIDGVRRLHLEGDSLAREGLDENLHFGFRGLEFASVWWEKIMVDESSPTQNLRSSPDTDYKMLMAEVEVMVGSF